RQDRRDTAHEITCAGDARRSRCAGVPLWTAGTGWAAGAGRSDGRGAVERSYAAGEESLCEGRSETCTGAAEFVEGSGRVDQTGERSGVDLSYHGTGAGCDVDPAQPFVRRAVCGVLEGAGGGGVKRRSRSRAWRSVTWSKLRYQQPTAWNGYGTWAQMTSSATVSM